MMMKNAMATKKRDARLDYMKGVLIFLVVYAHSMYWLTDSNSTEWSMRVPAFIYTFHMPLFVFLSGYFFSGGRKRPFWETVKDKFRRLIVPHFFFNILWLVPIFLFWSKYGHFLTRGEDGIITARSVYGYLTMFWYLWCVFFSSIISNVVYKFCPRPHCVNILLALVLYILSVLLPVRPFLNDIQMGSMYLFFVLGVLVRDHREIIASRKAVIAASVVYVAFLIVLFCHSSFAEGPLQELGKVGGIVCSYHFISFLYTRHFAHGYFLSLSRNTLFVYIYHFPVFYAVMGLYDFIGLGDYVILSNLMLAIIASAILSWVAEHLRYCRYLRGFVMGEYH